MIALALLDLSPKSPLLDLVSGGGATRTSSRWCLRSLPSNPLQWGRKNTGFTLRLMQHKAGVGGALILQNAVSNKYNRVINREGLNSLQALMRRPLNGAPVAITKATTMKTILGWVQSGVCSLDWALMEYMELVETEIDGDVRKRLMANYVSRGRSRRRRTTRRNR